MPTPRQSILSKSIFIVSVKNSLADFDRFLMIFNCTLKIFGIPQNDITVLAPFVGGGFGSGLRPSPNTFLTPLAAREVKRPVKIVYSRRQVFTAHGYRPYSIQKIVATIQAK